MSDADRDVVALIVDGDERVGEGGFLALRRLHLRNRRADGTTSAPYLCDAVVRPYGQDAVVLAIWARGSTIPRGALPPAPPAEPVGPPPPAVSRGSTVRVLVRDGLRPAIALGRDPARAPLPEPAPALHLTELVAGIVEEGDRGEAGLRTRAAHEAHEEAGFAVRPEDVVLLGAGLLPSPGCMVEKFYFAAVEVDPAAQEVARGDGSPMEEGARTRWLPLDDAIAACTRGELADLKTELGLRRLRDHLAGLQLV